MRDNSRLNAWKMLRCNVRLWAEDHTREAWLLRRQAALEIRLGVPVAE